MTVDTLKRESNMPRLMPDLLTIRDDAASDASDNETLLTAIDDDFANLLGKYNSIIMSSVREYDYRFVC
jgi:hypothetical protein